MATVDLFPHFRAFLESLNSERVKYLVVGGYAVIAYGHHRVTMDFDVWIGPGRANATRVSRALQVFGGFPASAVDPAMFEKPDNVFIFGREPARIDLLTSPDGVDFKSCHARRKMMNWDGIRVPVIAIEDLLVNKRASGRDKDLADIRGLQRKPPKRKRKETE